jgi:hypothetical protein
MNNTKDRIRRVYYFDLSTTVWSIKLHEKVDVILDHTD